jgi:hypothetical protein
MTADERIKGTDLAQDEGRRRMMDERCEHGVPLGVDNPNLPCSRCGSQVVSQEAPPKLMPARP